MNRIVRLYDQATDETYLYRISTKRGVGGSFVEFQRLYEEARREWYEGKDSYDCLIEHIQDYIAEYGYYLDCIEDEVMQLDF